MPAMDGRARWTGRCSLLRPNEQAPDLIFADVNDLGTLAVN